MNSRRARSSFERGFTAIELLVAMAILASVCLFAGAYLRTILRREKLKAAARELYSLVLAARIQALRHDSNVVLHVDLAARNVTSWADTSANFVRDPGEPLLESRRLPGELVFRSVSGTVDGPDGVAFDDYLGDPSLVDRIVFRSDGSLVVPQAVNSQPPFRPLSYGANVPAGSVNCPPTGCRGIFVADRGDGGVDRNLFRISVDDYSRIGKASLLKWLPTEQGGNSGERNFVPPPWKWVD
ncbi:MAG TPA: prepilin-type N-terminal cleavage/methylation domain-containing protein [Thermoanaerobaculia bacterium]